MSECQTCGACCTFFRVDFSVYELASAGGCVPDALAKPVNSTTCRMIGTDAFPLRCVALQGEVGREVGCGIYPLRPSPCHRLEEGSDGCDRARAKHGMPPVRGCPEVAPHG